MRCPDMLMLFNFNIPGSHRGWGGGMLFHEQFYRTLYGRFRAIDRLCMLANEYSDRILYTAKFTVISNLAILVFRFVFNIVLLLYVEKLFSNI